MTSSANTRSGHRRTHLAVRLLEASTSRASSELLGLAATRVSHQQGAVVRQQDVLHLLLLGLVHVLLVEGNDSLGDGLTDGVDLRDVASSADAHADVDHGEAGQAEQQHRLENLVLHALRADQLNGSTIELDQAAAALDVSDSHGSLLPAEGLNGIHHGGMDSMQGELK